MKRLITISMILICTFILACNTDRNELIIKDLENNGVDTSNLAAVDNSNNSSNDSGTALGSQKISITAVEDSTVSSSNITSVKVRAFVSRSPLVASSWFELTENSGTWTGEYPSAPNVGTAFGIHLQALSGSTVVSDLAGSESEYSNTGDGSTITGNTITITNTQ